MTSHYVICHVTSVICLFIIKEKEKENQKKRDIKSRKINKRKRKMLVFKHYHCHPHQLNTTLPQYKSAQLTSNYLVTIRVACSNASTDPSTVGSRNNRSASS